MILRTTQAFSEGHGKGKTEPCEPALVVVDELHEGWTSTSDSITRNCGILLNR